MAIPMEIVQGKNNLDKIILRGEGGSSAEIYLYGAQVTSWKYEHGDELLFVSSKAKFQPYSPTRGGIPICFPQFTDLGPLQHHGFACTSFWTLERETFKIPNNTGSSALVELVLNPKEEDLINWPNRFECRLRVTLSPKGELILTSRICNKSMAGKAFKFTFAYNTYVSVSDVRKIQVEGLETLHYLDNLRRRLQFIETEIPLTFEDEVDSIYLRTPSKITIHDYKKKCAVEIRKKGMADAGVWNPGDKKAKAIADLGKKDYKRMVCLGAAVADIPVTLSPGQVWTGALQLTFVKTCKSVKTCKCTGGVESNRRETPIGKEDRRASSKYNFTWFK